MGVRGPRLCWLEAIECSVCKRISKAFWELDYKGGLSLTPLDVLSPAGQVTREMWDSSQAAWVRFLGEQHRAWGFQEFGGGSWPWGCSGE